MAKTLQNIIDTISAEIETAFSNDVSVDSSSPIGQIIGLFAASDFELYQLSDAVRSQFNLSSASSDNLDILAKLFLATRKAATKAQFLNLSITGTANQTITGLQIKIVGKENTYTQEASFQFDNSGKAVAAFAADTAGVESISADISEISFTVLTSNPSVTSVSVGNGSYQSGQNLETDNTYRNRLQYSSAKNGTNIVDSLSGALLQDNDIDKVIVYEFKMSYRFNPTAAIRIPTDAEAWTGATTEKGVLGYFEPVVKLTADANKDNVAQIIWNNSPPGIICAEGYPDDPNKGTSISGTAYDAFNAEHTVYFTQALGVALKATVILKKATQGSTQNNKEAMANVQDALIKYLDNISIAGIARYSEAFCDIASANTGYYIETFTWAFGTATQDTNDKDLRNDNGARSYFDSTASDIVVTVPS